MMMMFVQDNHLKIITRNSQVYYTHEISIRFLSSLGELLLEWITLNSDSRNSNTQALIEQVKSCLQPMSNNNTKDV